MPYLPKTLPDTLRAAGLKVVTIDGWETRGRPASTGGFSPVGVLNHHTGGHDSIGDPENDLTYAKWMFLTGRSDLPAPLCQLSLSAEGVVYLGAAGRSNHAGTAKASGSVAQGDGNSLYVGIEWMLSGTQPIPAAMMKAGAILNAALLKHLGSSVQAVSCHYNTSVTGKWDIGDPNGVTFGNSKVLNVPKFRLLVQSHLDAVNKKPAKTKRESEIVRVMHTSLQFSDTPDHQTSDITSLFARAASNKVAWITGTEAGPGADPTNALLLAKGKEAGFRVFVPSTKKAPSAATDCWIAVNQEYIDGGWTTGYVPTIPGSNELYTEQRPPVSPDGKPRWGPKGIVWVSFTNKRFGKISVGAGHYLTKGRKSETVNGINSFEWNRRMAHALGDWARDKGKGKEALAFYGGDQNIVDRTEDTFFGSPLTSAWDEIRKWEDTGHGNIDVIASYDGDGRVRAWEIHALTDKEWPLHTDHYPVIAEFSIETLPNLK